MQITRRTIRRLLVSGFVLSLMSVSVVAQSTLYSIGLPTKTTTIPIEHGFIDIANGNVHLEFPFATHKLRGGLTTVSGMVYDSSIWQGGVGSSGGKQWVPTNVPGNMGGWRYVNNLNTVRGLVSYGTIATASSTCSNSPGPNVYQQGPFFYEAFNGTRHYFPVQTTQILNPKSGCIDPNYPVVSSGSAYAADGSGYYVTVTGQTTAYVYNPQGVRVATNDQTAGVHQYEDTNGNYENDDGLDDLGRQLVNPSTSGSTNTYSVLIENGQRASYTVTTEVINVYTHFISDSIGTDYNGPITVVQSIGLPDGTFYRFSYEQPDSEGRSEGELTSMTLPHGGTVSFAYQSGLNGTRAGVDVPARWVSQYIGGSGETDLSIIPVSSSCNVGCNISQDTYVTHNGVTLDYAYNLDPNGGLFNIAIATIPAVVTHKFGDNSETIIPTVRPLQTTYNTFTAGQSCPSYLCSTSGATMLRQPASTLTVFYDNGRATYSSVSYSTATLAAAGTPDTSKVWDYYTTSTQPYAATAPTTAASKERDVVYGASVNGALLPTSVSIKGAQGQNSYEEFRYDDATQIIVTSGITHHESIPAAHGLMTRHSVYRNATEVGNKAPSIVTYLYYYDTGSLQQVKDANGGLTTYGYDPTGTFVISTTYPTTGSATHVTSATYDTDGSLTSSTDQNKLKTSYNYDSVGRIHSISYPNSNQATYSYPSSNETDVSEMQSSGTSISSTSIVDGFGRFSSGTHGTVAYGTTYDSSGRVYCKATPAYSGSSSTTDGSTCFSYDPYDRISGVTQPDKTSTINVQYSDNVVTVTDELSRKKTLTYDASGNLITVMEPDASNNLTWETDYSYDTLNRLTNVTQKGGSTTSSQWRPRTFTYDYARLLSKTSPEAGTLTFNSYDGNGNVLSQTDALGLNVQYLYDALNRPTKKTLSSGAVYTYTYDGLDSSADPYPNMQLTSTSGPNTGELFKHDISGNLASEAFCTPSDCSYSRTVQGVYDYHGNLTSLTYPDGRQITSHFDLNDRPTDVTYAAWNGNSVNIPYATQMTYYPPGFPQSALLGNGVSLSGGVNNRLDITSLKYTLNSNNNILLSKTYNWDKNAANLISMVDNRTGTTRSFGYDYENRLTSAKDTVSGGTGPGTDGTGTLTLSGTEQAVTKTRCVIVNGIRRCTPYTEYDSGTVSVTIGSMTQSVTYGGASSTSTLASAIASAFNGATSSPATATVNGSTVTFTAKSDGTSSDYSLASSVTTVYPADFATPSFATSASGSSLQGGTAGTLLSETYTPDPWGNLQQSGNFSFVQTFDGNNHVVGSGISYFNNGNLKTDGLGGSFTYDSDSHILTANGSTYTYDPIGNRVRKDGSGSTEYFYFGGQLLTTYNVGSNTWNDYIYGGGRLLAENQGSQTAVASFRLGDNLDSLNQTTDGVGDATGSFDFTPYGQLFNNTGSDLLLFTDHERDTESNSDHTLYRQLSMAQGRWFTPDPSDSSYSLSDPQSLNRYAYLSNRPHSGVDLFGLDGGGGGGGGGFFGCLFCDLINSLESWFGKPGVINEHYGEVVKTEDDSIGAESGSGTPQGQAAPLDNAADLVIWGDDPGSFGEHLGLPRNIDFNAGGVLGALGLPGPGCEFGACGGGIFGFAAGQAASAPLDWCGPDPRACVAAFWSFIRSIPVAAATLVTLSMTGDNSGCVPAAGTQCHEEHSDHPHNGWQPHYHIWTRNQNPLTGQCFWNRGHGTSGATQFPPTGMRECSVYPTWPNL